MEDGAYIALNPGYADNNVILLSIRTDRGFTGTWHWSHHHRTTDYGEDTALRD